MVRRVYVEVGSGGGGGWGGVGGGGGEGRCVGHYQSPMYHLQLSREFQAFQS